MVQCLTFRVFRRILKLKEAITVAISILRNQSSGLDKPKLSAEQLQRINNSLNQPAADPATDDASATPAYIVELSNTALQQSSPDQVQTAQVGDTTQDLINTDTSYQDSPAYIVELSATALALQKQQLNPEQDKTKATSKTLIAQL